MPDNDALHPVNAEEPNTQESTPPTVSTPAEPAPDTAASSEYGEKRFKGMQRTAQALRDELEQARSEIQQLKAENEGLQTQLANNTVEMQTRGQTLNSLQDQLRTAQENLESATVEMERLQVLTHYPDLLPLQERLRTDLVGESWEQYLQGFQADLTSIRDQGASLRLQGSSPPAGTTASAPALNPEEIYSQFMSGELDPATNISALRVLYEEQGQQRKK